jgi:signal peptidase I
MFLPPPGSRVVAALLLALSLPPVLAVTVAQPWHVEGASMEPSLRDGTVLLVDAVGPRVEGVHRGDIVVLQLPSEVVYPHPLLVKRIVAVGGDHVVIEDGVVRINGLPVPEPYLLRGAHPPTTAPMVDVTVPHGDVFVMGDHRANSFDSKAFGPVPLSTIVGRAWFAIAPGGTLELPGVAAAAP